MLRLRALLCAIFATNFLLVCALYQEGVVVCRLNNTVVSDVPLSQLSGDWLTLEIYDSAPNGTQPKDMCVKMNINVLNTTHMNWTHEYVNTSINRLESYSTIKTQVKVLDPEEQQVDDGSPKTAVNLGEWVDVDFYGEILQTQLLAADTSRYLVIADCEIREYDEFGTVYYKLTEIAFLKRRGVELNQTEINYVHQIVDHLFPRTETRKSELNISC